MAMTRQELKEYRKDYCAKWRAEHKDKLREYAIKHKRTYSKDCRIGEYFEQARVYRHKCECGKECDGTLVRNKRIVCGECFDSKICFMN